jgi:hypothetical protein
LAVLESVPTNSRNPLVLIDRSHRRWMVGTALAVLFSGALYWWLGRLSPEPLTGGTTAGLWFGIAGAALMVYAGLLAAHRRMARWPLLPRRSWMLKGHIWLGLLSFWLILCHSNFRWGGALDQLLWIVFGLVVLSGMVGLVLQGVLPRLMLERIEEETPYEQMPHVCRQLARSAAQLAETLALNGTGDVVAKPNTGRGQLRTFYEADIAPFLAGAAPPTSALHDTARARERFAQFLALPEFADDRVKLLELEQLCNRRRQIAVQERLHHWLHGWLFLHVPLSLALLVLGSAHVVMSLYF